MRPFLATLGACAAVALLGGHVLAWMYGMPRPPVFPAFFMLSLCIVGFGALFALIGYILWLAAWEREPDPIPRVLSTVRHYTSLDYLARHIAPIVLCFLFLSVFNTFKVFIPHIQPFYLDGFLSDLDRWVFGIDPWRITHAVIGPVGTYVIELCYGLWFPAWFLAVLHFSLFAREELQQRFFISFVGIWAVLGIGMATLLSSAGPCFLELIHHPYADRYADLFPLQDAPGATGAQAYLAKSYLAGDIGLAKGISAMPSVHVAIAALLVLAVRSYGRFVFAGALFLYMMILIGSVHLGWHYASDGVVGTLGAMLLWRLTRPAASGAVAAPTGEANFQES